LLIDDTMSAGSDVTFTVVVAGAAVVPAVCSESETPGITSLTVFDERVYPTPSSVKAASADDVT
jgi:hypothetical protein